MLKAFSRSLKNTTSGLAIARAYSPKLPKRKGAHYYKDGVKHVIATDDGLAAV